MYSCYLRKGIVYIPTWGKIDKGHYRGVEPIAVVPVSDTDGLWRAFRETIARGNPVVPRLPRAQIPPPAILKYAGVKTWGAFSRGTLSWNINELINDGFQIVGKRKSPSGGFIDDPQQTVTMPPGSNVEDVIERMISILQETAREPRP